MDMRQPGQLVYGRLEDAPAIDEAPHRGTQIALLALIVALGAATVGYIVHPAFRGAPAAPARACEVILLESGSPDCVTRPAVAAAAAAKTKSETKTPASQQTKRRPSGSTAP
jgi:hypothetical protein